MGGQQNALASTSGANQTPQLIGSSPQADPDAKRQPVHDSIDKIIQKAREDRSKAQEFVTKRDNEYRQGRIQYQKLMEKTREVEAEGIAIQVMNQQLSDYNETLKSFDQRLKVREQSFQQTMDDFDTARQFLTDPERLQFTQERDPQFACSEKEV